MQLTLQKNGRGKTNASRSQLHQAAAKVDELTE
jgi:hypothetical protein